MPSDNITHFYMFLRSGAGFTRLTAKVWGGAQMAKIRSTYKSSLSMTIYISKHTCLSLIIGPQVTHHIQQSNNIGPEESAIDIRL